MNMRQELIRLALDSGSGGGSDITVTELKVEENGTYEKEGYAFSPVIVDVPSGGGAIQWTNLSYFYESGVRMDDLPPSKLDTSQVTNMTYMFYSSRNITSIELGDKFDTSNVTTMNSMFSGCRELTSLDLTGWDTNRVASMSSFITNCIALKDVYIRDSELRSDGKLKFKLPVTKVFDQIRTNGGNIHLSATLQSAYSTATNWTAYTDIMLFDLP